MIKSKIDRFLQILIILIKTYHQTLWGISGESPKATSTIVDHLLWAPIIRLLLTYPYQTVYCTLPCYPIQQKIRNIIFNVMEQHISETTEGKFMF